MRELICIEIKPDEIGTQAVQDAFDRAHVVICHGEVVKNRIGKITTTVAGLVATRLSSHHAPKEGEA